MQAAFEMLYSLHKVVDDLKEDLGAAKVEAQNQADNAVKEDKEKWQKAVDLIDKMIKELNDWNFNDLIMLNTDPADNAPLISINLNHLRLNPQKYSEFRKSNSKEFVTSSIVHEVGHIVSHDFGCAPLSPESERFASTMEYDAYHHMAPEYTKEEVKSFQGKIPYREWLLRAYTSNSKRSNSQINPDKYNEFRELFLNGAGGWDYWKY
jgi:hypothetical protein